MRYTLENNIIYDNGNAYIDYTHAEVAQDFLSSELDKLNIFDALPKLKALFEDIDIRTARAVRPIALGIQSSDDILILQSLEQEAASGRDNRLKYKNKLDELGYILNDDWSVNPKY